MTGEDQCIGNDHVLTSPRSKDNNLSNIITSERLAAPKKKGTLALSRCMAMKRNHSRIDSISLRLITVETHNRELRLNLSGINLDNADSRRN